MCTGKKVLAGTSVGMVLVIDSEDIHYLPHCFQWHKDRVLKLLTMPQEMKACVCAEIPFPKDREEKTDQDTCGAPLENPLIASMGHGRVRYHSHTEGEEEEAEGEKQITLLTWSM